MRLCWSACSLVLHHRHGGCSTPDGEKQGSTINKRSSLPRDLQYIISAYTKGTEQLTPGVDLLGLTASATTPTCLVLVVLELVMLRQPQPLCAQAAGFHSAQVYNSRDDRDGCKDTHACLTQQISHCTTSRRMDGMPQHDDDCASCSNSCVV